MSLVQGVGWRGAVRSKKELHARAALSSFFPCLPYTLSFLPLSFSRRVLPVSDVIAVVLQRCRVKEGFFHRRARIFRCRFGERAARNSGRERAGTVAPRTVPFPHGSHACLQVRYPAFERPLLLGKTAAYVNCQRIVVESTLLRRGSRPVYRFTRGFATSPAARIRLSRLCWL